MPSGHRRSAKQAQALWATVKATVKVEATAKVVEWLAQWPLSTGLPNGPLVLARPVFCGEWRRVSFRGVCVCVVFCGEWRRVSFQGGEGEWGRVSFGVGVVVVYFLFLGGGGESASGGAKGNGGESALELGVVVVYFLFFGGPMSTGSPNEYGLAQ